MKITVYGLNALPDLFRGIPRYSYTNVLHFEVKGEWLYFGVSGWAFGYRNRFALAEPAAEEISFSVVTDEFLRDLSVHTEFAEVKAVELDINPTMKNVFRVIDGTPRVYNMVSTIGKFIPTGGTKYELTGLDEWDEAVSDDPLELITVVGGQVYVNNPLSADAPIFRVNQAEEVENFSTSALLVRLAPYVPTETPLTLTPTHAMLRDEERDVYVFTERYMENPYYTSKSLLYGLLMSAGGKNGLPVPEGFSGASVAPLASGPLALKWDAGKFTVEQTDGAVLYEGAYAEPEGAATSQRIWVGYPDLERAIRVCGEDLTLAISSASGRDAILARGTKGAALLPLKEF